MSRCPHPLEVRGRSGEETKTVQGTRDMTSGKGARMLCAGRGFIFVSHASALIAR